AIQNAGPPTLITLATGAPNSTLFPFHEATITLKDGSSFKLSDSLMTAALQYGPTPGFTPLVKWLKGLQQRLHNPPTLTRPGPEGGLDLVVTTGSMDGLAKAFDMLIKPGDNILIDTPTYAGTLSALHPLGCNFLDVQTDHCGMVPDALRNKLSKWTPGDSKKADSDIPKVLYTIPNGCNPTGASLTESRKREIYK
ncbi:kynurenine/alpha-aminoadipate aminotransferase, mitochondrial-like, partial [Lingula anatina]